MLLSVFSSAVLFRTQPKMDLSRVIFLRSQFDLFDSNCIIYMDPNMRALCKISPSTNVTYTRKITCLSYLPGSAGTRSTSRCPKKKKTKTKPSVSFRLPPNIRMNQEQSFSVPKSDKPVYSVIPAGPACLKVQNGIQADRTLEST